ncbi:hypothetical protein [Tenacibaculum sp. SG-28]|uniref:hypothetical protein n=1 Tax=Tenacibaculum sp. SG-28 TaxID=754426 RepID=UPI000CF4A46C|nr:hypothetical protein [Tenacibaculum sp. SG-28]PQJ21935.1 LSU ribosomal protein L21p [Tenacibaculum sp. SG-28]
MNIFDIIPCWLIPLLVGAICAYLGYLLGKSTNNEKEDSAAIIAKLESDLDACEKSKTELQGKLNAAAKAQDLPFDAAAAKAAYGKKINHDDLKIIEGIGPKIEGLFTNFGITTWRALSETSVEKCQEVLNSGGERYRVHNPGTWPTQAKLAYEGQWKKLVQWQDELKGGKI